MLVKENRMPAMMLAKLDNYRRQITKNLKACKK